MNTAITPKDVFLVEKYLNENLRSKENKRMSSNDYQTLLFEVIEPIRNLVKYGYSKNYSKYGEIYSEIEVGVNGIKRLIDINPQIIKDALQLYKTDQEENLYLILLDKKISDMTGYEVQILFSFLSKKQ